MRTSHLVLFWVVFAGLLVGSGLADEPVSGTPPAVPFDNGSFLGNLFDPNAIFDGPVPPQNRSVHGPTQSFDLKDFLIAVAPVITSTDKTCSRIEIRGFMEAGETTRLAFRALYRSPDQYALLISDGVDGVPLIYVADRKLLIYDPVRPVVLYGTSASLEFSLKASEDRWGLMLNWRWNTKKPSEILLDLQSILRATRKDTMVVNQETTREGVRYEILGGFENGPSIRAHVARSTSTSPYTDLKIYDSCSNTLYVSIDRIVVNGPLKDEEFAFPTKERLAEQISVRDCSEDGLLKTLGAFGLMMRTLYVRMAAHNPEMRSGMGMVTATVMVGSHEFVRVVVPIPAMRGSSKIPGLVGIDWDRVKENDKTYSKTLLQLIVPEGRSD